MKETKIARFNLDSLKIDLVCQEHKQTCERWLDFLEKALSHFAYGDIRLERKVKDLKKAIKSYEENGI